MEKSLNQPTLPHAVIALNDTKIGVDEQEWNPDYATNALMSSVAEVVQQDSSYRALADFWIGRGRTIHTILDLLECYYSSVTVVRIPGYGHYMKIDDQVSKLNNIIRVKSAESFRAKRRSRMLSNSEELNIYLQCAFDHFSQDLDTPFNFMDVAFRINPIESDFGGKILKLAVGIKNSPHFIDPLKQFRELSFMVASCILLDCVRQNLMDTICSLPKTRLLARYGPYDVLMRTLLGRAEQILEKAYINYCDTVLDDFCAMFWPCKFKTRRGRCVNVQKRHQKGHQNDKGQIIGTGAYESDFTFDSFAEEWLQLLQKHLSKFQQNVDQQEAHISSPNEIQATTQLHCNNVNSFYQSLGGAQLFISHSACFCCLREIAEHALPCGHVLCTPCIKGYGKY